jgi:hypothetical protein
VFKIFQISGVNLDFRGVKKRQGGWGKKFSCDRHSGGLKVVLGPDIRNAAQFGLQIV